MKRIIIEAWGALLLVFVLSFIVNETFYQIAYPIAAMLAAIYVGFALTLRFGTSLSIGGTYASSILVLNITLGLLSALVGILTQPQMRLWEFKYFVLASFIMAPLVFGLGVLGSILARAVRPKVNRTKE